jgi:hypothetical protein
LPASGSPSPASSGAASTSAGRRAAINAPVRPTSPDISDVTNIAGCG